MSTLKTQRRQREIFHIVSRRAANVGELSVHFGVSESTIRRDLAELANGGLILRTYGGAALWREEQGESSLGQRIHIQREQKEAIARLAAAQVRAGQTLILDAGTTTAALARCLRGRRNLHVITNNLAVLTTLANETEIALTLLGGSLRKKSMGTVGPLAELTLSRMSADQVFLGADGLVAERGLCEVNQEQIALKEKMIAQARKVCVLADASKLGFSGQPAWSPLDLDWTLITDASATPAQLAPFRERSNITVMVASLSRRIKPA